ncbi:MAG TPA: response regulator [Verrucomicrobiae bacterium]
MDNERKNILVLEDSETRIGLMREALGTLPGSFTLQCWDNVWAMRKQMPRWLPSAYLISLDYDLGDSRTPNPGNGMDAVQALSGHQPMCPIIVHTSLSQEGREMVRALRERGWSAEQVLFNKREAVQEWLNAVEMLTGLDQRHP